MVLRTSSKGHATRTPDRLLIEPERARPVPFWRHGFLPNQLLQHESSEHEYPDEHQLLSNNNLVNQRFVEITTEGSFETVSALCASFNTNSIAISLRFTAGLTIRSLPVAPGTAPLTAAGCAQRQRVLRQGSERLHFVTHLTCHFLAFEHFARGLV